MIVPIPRTLEPETRGPGFPCTAFRWSFQAERWSLAIVHQHQSGGAWYDSHTAVWSVSLAPWRWSVDHFWYDGPHCGAHLGFVAIQWHNPGCRKCCCA